MNGQDKITVIAAKLDSAIERRRRVIKADTVTLTQLNQVLLSSNGDDASERFSKSLEKLLKAVSE